MPRSDASIIAECKDRIAQCRNYDELKSQMTKNEVQGATRSDRASVTRRRVMSPQALGGRPFSPQSQSQYTGGAAQAFLEG